MLNASDYTAFGQAEQVLLRNEQHKLRVMVVPARLKCAYGLFPSLDGEYRYNWGVQRLCVTEDNYVKDISRDWECAPWVEHVRLPLQSLYTLLKEESSDTVNYQIALDKAIKAFMVHTDSSITPPIFSEFEKRNWVVRLLDIKPCNRELPGHDRSLFVDMVLTEQQRAYVDPGSGSGSGSWSGEEDEFAPIDKARLEESLEREIFAEGVLDDLIGLGFC